MLKYFSFFIRIEIFSLYNKIKPTYFIKKKNSNLQKKKPLKLVYISKLVDKQIIISHSLNW